MRTKGIYYLGRVIKMGILTEDMIFEAIQNPVTISWRSNAWTIISASVHEYKNLKYVYGKLCKFTPETEVDVIDLMKKAVIKQPERNVILASSPFVYIPEHSGIAFLRIWNHIEAQIFIRRFCSIVAEAHQGFFVDCKIEPIADMRTFAIKLSKMEGIYSISAKVFPPNPFFGPLWRSLKDYLRDRNTESLKIQEDSANDEPLKTMLPEQVQSIATQSATKYPLKESLPIGDAAILMAADGYGSGLVRGRVGSEFVVIRTSETIKNFSFEKDPDPEKLYEEAVSILENIEHDSHMEHETK